MSSIEINLGKQIKKIRESLELSQEELAEEAGLHRTYISQVERGIKSPSVKTLIKVSEALGVKASELLRKANI